MTLIKKQSKKTYKSEKTGKDVHYYNFFLELDNGKRVQIKPAFNQDTRTLDAIAKLEK